MRAGKGFGNCLLWNWLLNDSDVFFTVTYAANLLLISQHVREPNDAHAAVLMDLRESFGFFLFHVTVEGGAAHCEHLPGLLRTNECILILRHSVTFI